MERPNVPKFGNWDKGADEVPYTVYFDKARKGKGAGRKMINPNDPEENPDLFSDNSTDQIIRSRKSSIDDQSPTHQRRGSNSSSTRPTRLSGGSDRGSIDRSPLHPQYRGKPVGVSAGSSPVRDNKSPRHSSQGNRTPGRTRMKPHGTPERGGGAAIPPFGQWDENDPESAENYTHIFKQASEEKQTGSSNAPSTISDPSNYKNPKQKANDQGCCFGWF